MGEYCRMKQLEFQANGMLGRREVTPEMFSTPSKRMKIDYEEPPNTFKIKCAFIRVNFQNDPDLPKSKIIAYCGRNQLKVPSYRIINEHKLFRAIATLDGKCYSSTYW